MSSKRAHRLRTLADSRAASSPEDLTRLRQVIVGPESARLDALESRTVVSSEGVATVLPEAIALSTEARKEALAIALEPVVESSLCAIARRDADVLSDVLSPCIGPAVRKAVSEAIAALLARLDNALERSVSFQSIRWRIEARRTGRPFAEVVLLRTLRYRVEQVFLIHTKTSLVLEHVVDPATEAQPPDQVAAMLAAIDAFGREALGPLPASSHLERFQFGELTVCVHADPWITLVAVVRGVAPGDLDDRLREAEDRIRLAYQAKLDAFTGDVAPFAGTTDVLIPLLRAERKAPSKKGALVAGLGALVVLALAFAFVARVIVRSADERRLAKAYADALSTEPGLVVTQSEWKDGRASFAGLRDPLAATPDVVLRRNGLAPLSEAELALSPFVSSDPRLTRARLVRILAPPPGVALVVDGTVLRVTGVAPKRWIEDMRMLSRGVPTVEQVDESELRSDASLADVNDARAELQASVIPFRRGEASLRTNTRAAIDQATAATVTALHATAAARLDACIEIWAHADPTGTDAGNQILREARAAVVARAFVDAGIDQRNLRPRTDVQPAGESRPEVTLRLDTACEAAR
jgi:outer membrane protein OmpA-like peptidoglycan-associated protein